MAEKYLSFLTSPSPQALSANASFHYITTTTTISEATAIVKHLQAQEKLLKKKSETVLSSVAGSDGVVIETETTIEFIRGGGAILPQMDDNMLADSVVVVPMVHIVQFDSAGKITQVRLHWDQATMLKQVEAIGKSGRNWPIRDGQSMANLIKRSVGAAGSDPAGPQAFFDATKKADQVVISARPSNTKDENNPDFHSRPSSMMGENKPDFHARLFATGDTAEPRSDHNRGPSVAKRMSAKPAPRQWDELFATDSYKSPPSAKVEGAILKAGAGTNFGQNRMFHENAPEQPVTSPDGKKADPSKYNHFEFGNGEEAAPHDGNRPPSAKEKKHMNKWDFQDFVTPPKAAPKYQPDQERHFGHGVDDDEPPSPAKRPIVHAPRQDAKPHFHMTDEPSPAGDRQQQRTTRPEAFVNHVRSADGVLAEEDMHKKPLGRVTNVNSGRRVDEYNSHYTATDSSPAPTNDENARSSKSGQGFGAAKLRSEKEQAHWKLDETPEKPRKIYKTAGDGMGTRKGAMTAAKAIIGEDEDQVQESKIYKTYGNGMGGRRDTAPIWSWGDRDEEVESQQSKNPDRKIFKTAGNGMGSKSSRDLILVDEDEDF